MSHLFPPPPIQPFERMQARDGLLITAERWLRTQRYHRQRQNFHYQSLHRPGIVCGLGVRPISPTGSEPTHYRDGRSFQLQPGIAIDLRGNPIIVPQPENVQIGVEPLPDQPLTVYITLSYRDPEELSVSPDLEMMREQFRIDIKTRPPQPDEVEVCRVLIPPGQPLQLQPAADIFFPGYHNLDFRYRQQVCPRPLGMVRVAQMRHEDPGHNRNFANLDALLKSVEVNYPALAGSDQVDMLALDHPDLAQYDLLYVTGATLSLSKAHGDALAGYLATGGVLLVDVPDESSELARYMAGFVQNQLKLSLEPLTRRHPLRRQPFLFAALPLGSQSRPVQLFVAGGVIVCMGDIAGVWGLDEKLSLSRTQIREGQELGINLLHYAWLRHGMTQLQQ
ncbi:MAG: DUF4159 domain-containing protein [Cyanophyceae cyanobacterium]